MAKYVGTTDLSTLEDEYMSIEYSSLDDEELDDWLDVELDDDEWEED